MTFGQMRLYAQAAERRRRRDLRDQVVNLRAAQYDTPNFKKYVKGLDEH